MPEAYKQDREWLETLEHATVGYHDVDVDLERDTELRSKQRTKL